MVGQHQGLNGHEFEQTLGDGEDRGAWPAAVHGLAELDKLRGRTRTAKKLHPSAVLISPHSPPDSLGLSAQASAYNAGDPGVIPGSGRSPGEGNGTHSSALAWKTPWTEEPGGLQSMGSRGVGHD